MQYNFQVLRIALGISFYYSRETNRKSRLNGNPPLSLREENCKARDNVLPLCPSPLPLSFTHSLLFPSDRCALPYHYTTVLFFRRLFTRFPARSHASKRRFLPSLSFFLFFFFLYPPTPYLTDLSRILMRSRACRSRMDFIGTSFRENYGTARRSFAE